MRIRDIVKKANRFDLAARHERLQSPEIIQRTKAVRHPTIGFAIFEVQSNATGDGVYNCYKQTLDKTEWDDTTGDNKFDDLNTTSVEVLNLAEFDPEATYVRHLTAGDLIVAWRVGDDEDNPRWAGVPLRQANADRPRLAFCKDDAGASTSIDCYLDVDATGTVISVSCNTSPKNQDLDTCIRRLNDGDPILVTKIGATWYAQEGFQQIDTDKGLEISDDKLAVNIDTDELQFDSGAIKTNLDECS